MAAFSQSPSLPLNCLSKETVQSDFGCTNCNLGGGTTYYVGINGSDSFPGTESKPWKTLDKAVALVQAGDTVHVFPGIYQEDFTISTSGTKSNPITFIGDKNTKLVTDRSQKDASIWIKADYIVLKNFDITGNVHVKGRYNVIESNYIHNSYEKGGIHLSSKERNGSDTTYNTVRNNTIYKTVGTGIYIEGQNHLISGNEISRIMDIAPDGSNKTDADGMNFFGSCHLIRDNYIHDIWQTDMAGAPHIDMIQTWAEAHDIVFERNVMHNPNPTGSNRILMLERKHNAGPVSNLTWINNIFIFSDDNSSFMQFNRKRGQPEIKNMVIVNNVFFSPYGLVEKAASFNNITGVTFKNNLIINTGLNSHPYVAFREFSGTSGIDAGNNVIFNTDGSKPANVIYPGDLWMVAPQVIGPRLSDRPLGLHKTPDN